MDKLYIWMKNIGLGTEDLEDEEVIGYVFQQGATLGMDPVEIQSSLSRYIEDITTKEVKAEFEILLKQVNDAKNSGVGNVAELRNRRESISKKFSDIGGFNLDNEDSNWIKQTNMHIATGINILERNQKQAEADAAAAELNSKYHAEDRAVKLGRIREDNRTNSLRGIAKALGIPLPDKLFDSAKAFTRASEDTERIKQRAKEENRELNEEEQKKLETLEETMERTKGAHELLQKLNPALQQLGPQALVAATTLGLVTKAFGAMANSGKDASTRIDKIQENMNVFGESVNDANLRIADLESKMATSASNISMYLGETFSKLYEGLLMVGNLGLNIAEGVIGVTTGNAGILKPSGVTYNDPYFGSFLRYIKSNTKLDERITDEHLYGMFGTIGDAMYSGGFDMDTMAYAAEALTYNYLHSDRFTLDNGGEAAVENMSEIVDSIIGRSSISSLGINNEEDVLRGYAFSQFGVNWDTLNDQWQTMIAYRHTLESLQNKNRAALQEETKGYKELGMAIEGASGALFSFDQAEVLNAENFGIPDLEDFMDATFGSAEEFSDTLKDGLTEGATEFSNQMDQTMNKVRNDIDTKVAQPLVQAGNNLYNSIYSSLKMGVGVISSVKNPGTGNFADLDILDIENQTGSLAFMHTKPVSAHISESGREHGDGGSSRGTVNNYHLHLNDAYFDNEESRNNLARDIKGRIDLMDQRGG